ncbi:hypothetical protein RCL_jg22870.t1 [Rhizophagus clarus]|uniref:Uncharacterized protein n=1 Tax=Rhizophagus clarus TaxID=94130 RepID=A0A8H3QM61_9GLOM|nr:hypothetical protein RCL_jg22870.t1 [Rhizophagus clarus]
MYGEKGQYSNWYGSNISSRLHWSTKHYNITEDLWAKVINSTIIYLDLMEILGYVKLKLNRHVLVKKWLKFFIWHNSVLEDYNKGLRNDRKF